MFRKTKHLLHPEALESNLSSCIIISDPLTSTVQTCKTQLAELLLELLDCIESSAQNLPNLFLSSRLSTRSYSHVQHVKVKH